MLQNLIIKTQCKALALKNTMQEKLVSKTNGDAQLVVALILVVVAIGLCILFQDTIADTMKDVFGKITEAINDLSGKAAPTS